MRRLGVVALALVVGSLVAAGAAARFEQRPSFSFSAVEPTDAVAGQKYPGHPFCKPPPPGARQCGAFYVTTNPRGGFPPYTFSLRNVVPGLHVNVRTGLLFGTVPKGAQKREWPFTVCATESRTPKFQQPRTRCDETSITITGAEPPVTIQAHVAAMQTEVQRWQESFDRAFVGYQCVDGVDNFPAGVAEFAAAAARVGKRPTPAGLEEARTKIVQALTLMSDGFKALDALNSSSALLTRCGPHPEWESKRTLAAALMYDFAEGVAAKAGAAGLSVDPATLVPPFNR
ncbi:MAG: hypothetical protein HY511_03025 [Actinobacteria bacterium]|nr:hypothetical protein [Actinomycetota bacterium]